jgi:hypothetical protein
MPQIFILTDMIFPVLKETAYKYRSGNAINQKSVNTLILQQAP